MLLMYVAGGTADCFSGSQSAHLCINSSTTVSDILTERQVYFNTTVFQTILGDPGADSGGGGKSKRAEK